MSLLPSRRERTTCVQVGNLTTGKKRVESEIPDVRVPDFQSGASVLRLQIPGDIGYNNPAIAPDAEQDLQPGRALIVQQVVKPVLLD